LTTAVTVEEKGDGEMKVPERLVCHDLDDRLPGLGVREGSDGNIGGTCPSLIGVAGFDVPACDEVAVDRSMTESAESVLSPLGGAGVP
jgi:hypothetical protein